MLKNESRGWENGVKDNSERPTQRRDNSERGTTQSRGQLRVRTTQRQNFFVNIYLFIIFLDANEICATGLKSQNK